ncbi:MAG TPA: type III pantothenate kinase [Acholeplasmatales bacterium]|nr:type III pantothenate kinase [Acholeplasmatales bacterium]
MLVLIDIGNTTVGIGVSKNLTAVDKTFKINTEKNRSSDEYAMTMNLMFKEIPVTAVIISSVVPELNDVFREYFQAWHDITPIFLGAGVKTGIRILSDNPREVGSDLIANAVAATERYAKTCLIVDLGTATTFTYVENLGLKGVIISTGLTTSRNALISKTSQLPQIELELPNKLIGTTSIDSIKSGIVYGHASMIDGIIGRIKRQLGNPALPVILTGGHAKLIHPLCEQPMTLDERLIFEGLLLIYQRNQNKIS